MSTRIQNGVKRIECVKVRVQINVEEWGERQTAGQTKKKKETDKPDRRKNRQRHWRNGLYVSGKESEAKIKIREKDFLTVVFAAFPVPT